VPSPADPGAAGDAGEFGDPEGSRAAVDPFAAPCFSFALDDRLQPETMLSPRHAIAKQTHNNKRWRTPRVA